ncbi:tRNA lysidine(34) synthetase TilS [Acidovorax sp. A79]|uniref:tRNA lysidine(34) synthetase TilS n=1 Tax=Acidovorax sp. A79 TaxID=3056107 RepID=UPI0034E8CA7E
MTLSFDAAMQAFEPALPLAVGFSGGADSTALLLACARRWPGQVRAIHVHHGLQPAADGFARHCEDLCQALDVPLAVQRPDARHAPGQSPEDAARQARYKAFEAVALASKAHNAIKSIAIAQHADDQVETLVLALSRGAGVAGLAAMPARWRRAGIDWYRPLLRVAGADVRQWLRAQGQGWVEDPTNADERFTRNRIRARILPVLEAAFPAFRDTFARSAQHAAQADELLEELALQDLAIVGAPPRIRALQGLSRARQANVLRHWLRVEHHTTAAAAQLNELLDQVQSCTTRGHRIHIKVGHGFAVRSGPELDWYSPEVLAP